MRFALKSRRGPHFPIASDAPKHLRKEIERRIDVVKDIRCDPRLLKDDAVVHAASAGDSQSLLLPLHVYRMQAVDSLKLLEQDIVTAASDESRRRPAGQDVRFYLQKQARDASGPLHQCDPSILSAFVDSYLHARHDATPFTADHYKSHVQYLNHLRDVARNRCKSVKRESGNKRASAGNNRDSGPGDRENGGQLTRQRNVLVSSTSDGQAKSSSKVSLSLTEQQPRSTAAGIGSAVTSTANAGATAAAVTGSRSKLSESAV